MSIASEITPALLGRNIRKAFHRESGEMVQALDGVSLNAAHGTLTALVGPDGAGKTTLIRLAAGLLFADSGDLKVLGVDVSTDPQQVQDRIGYMPQKFGLYEDLTVQENIDLYADLHGVTEDERDEKDSNRVVPVEEFEAIVLHALVGIGPGAPADGARDHHQQRDTQRLWCIHRGSLCWT